MPVLDGLLQGVLKRTAGLDCRLCCMKHEIKSATHPHDNELGGFGEWIALLVVWFAAIAMSLSIVCVLLSPAE